MNNLRGSAANVDGIPVAWIQPDNQGGDARIALWLPWLTGTKEAAVPFLAELAGLGFTAVSFELWQHGERGTETGERIASRVFGGFRRHMWPILGQTTLDALRVTDWAAAEFGARDVAAGGVSAVVSTTMQEADWSNTTVLGRNSQALANGVIHLGYMLA